MVKGSQEVTGNKMLRSCMPLSLRLQLFCVLVRGAAALQIRELWGTEAGLSGRKLGKDRGEKCNPGPERILFEEQGYETKHRSRFCFGCLR